MTEILYNKIPLLQKQAFLVHKNLLYRIVARITFLGRHPSNNLILNAPMISRFHARIKYEDGSYSLYDFGSKYGTYVNGDQIKMQNLKSGDKIKLADVEIEFYFSTEEIAALGNRDTGDLKRAGTGPHQIIEIETRS
jgi:pSer/pThr/pTyr-binding forkhead associated (FHA) protein